MRKRCPPFLKFIFTVFLLFPASCSDLFAPTLPSPAQSALIQNGLVEITNNNVAAAVLNDLTDLGARYPGNPNLDAYRNRLEAYFTACGLAVTRQPVTCAAPRFAYGPVTMENLIWTLAGADASLAPVLVTAHWDSIPWGPGADDNASGCAGVIEIARVISALSLHFRRPITFVLFALEEESLVGSAYYAAHMSRAPALVLNMDLIGFTSARETLYPLSDVLLGFPATGDFIGVLASRPSGRAGLTWARAADDFVPDLPYYFAVIDGNVSNDPLITQVMRSDHASFWPYGVPAIMFSDTAEFREGAPCHTFADAPAAIDATFMLNVIKSVFADLCIEAELIP